MGREHFDDFNRLSTTETPNTLSLLSIMTAENFRVGGGGRIVSPPFEGGGGGVLPPFEGGGGAHHHHHEGGGGRIPIHLPDGGGTPNSDTGRTSGQPWQIDRGDGPRAAENHQREQLSIVRADGEKPHQKHAQESNHLEFSNIYPVDSGWHIRHN